MSGGRRPARAAQGVLPEGKREQNKREKFERIQRAAYALFLERGVAETTLSAVAVRAKVAKGTLFLYAEDKADLVFLVMHDRIARAVDAQLATLSRTAPLLEQLLHLFRGLFRMYGEHPELSHAFIRGFPGAKGPNAMRVHGLTHAFVATLSELVRAAGARGELADEPFAAQAAQNFFALYFAALMTWVSDLEPLERALETRLREALQLQIRGLLPRAGTTKRR